MNCFGHSGDLGDIIWALPTIRAAGGGRLSLINYPGRTTFPMTEERFNAIRPLLLQQTYVDDVRFAGDDISQQTNINGFRDHCSHNRNLADAHLATHGLPFLHRNHAWLHVNISNRCVPIVFARSARYQNDRFPWQQIVEAYGRYAVFLGSQDEHVAFISNFGHVPFMQTSDLLEAAKVIAGAQLFIGNQSCLHAIAEGLKQNIILEVYPSQPNCIFSRMGVIHGWDDTFELPYFRRCHQLFPFIPKIGQLSQDEG